MATHTYALARQPVHSVVIVGLYRRSDIGGIRPAARLASTSAACLRLRWRAAVSVLSGGTPDPTLAPRAEFRGGAGVRCTIAANIMRSSAIRAGVVFVCCTLDQRSTGLPATQAGVHNRARGGMLGGFLRSSTARALAVSRSLVPRINSAVSGYGSLFDHNAALIRVVVAPRTWPVITRRRRPDYASASRPTQGDAEACSACPDNYRCTSTTTSTGT